MPDAPSKPKKTPKASAAGAKKPKPRPEGRPPKYDWMQIRREYIRGDDEVTYKSLSHKPGYPAEGSITNRAAREGWTELRAQFRDDVMRAMRQADLDLKTEVRLRQARAGKAMLDVGLRGLVHVDPERLEPIDVARLVKTGADLERKALGMEELNVNMGSIRSPEDLDSLDDTALYKILGALPPEDDDDGQ